MSIKEYAVRVRKNGKTRGRPSKKEILLSMVTSALFKKNQSRINKFIADTIMMGEGLAKVNYIKSLIK